MFGYENPSFLFPVDLDQLSPIATAIHVPLLLLSGQWCEVLNMAKEVRTK